MFDTIYYLYKMYDIATTLAGVVGPIFGPGHL